MRLQQSGSQPNVASIQPAFRNQAPIESSYAVGEEISDESDLLHAELLPSSKQRFLQKKAPLRSYAAAHELHQRS
ncbi:MAG: hypothetical protein JJT87_11300 [Halomonas sp.]|nr:hypothetical protein [Halomonas sp.]AQU83346.1 hypothetical protein B2G49_12660 [Halomonas sp. 'Soap Lake \